MQTFAATVFANPSFKYFNSYRYSTSNTSPHSIYGICHSSIIPSLRSFVLPSFLISIWFLCLRFFLLLSFFLSCASFHYMFFMFSIRCGCCTILSVIWRASFTWHLECRQFIIRIYYYACEKLQKNAILEIWQSNGLLKFVLILWQRIKYREMRNKRVDCLDSIRNGVFYLLGWKKFMHI